MISTSCVVRAVDEIDYFEPGNQYDVNLELLLSAEYSAKIDLTQPVVLAEGSKVIATGFFTDQSRPSN